MTEAEAESANDRTRATGGTVRATRTQSQSGVFSSFKRAARAIARRYDPRRAFAQAAHIMRRAFPLPAEAHAPALAYLAQSLDWLNLWEDNAAAEDDFDANIRGLCCEP
jgi:hypothetical protein